MRVPLIGDSIRLNAESLELDSPPFFEATHNPMKESRRQRADVGGAAELPAARRHSRGDES